MTPSYRQLSQLSALGKAERQLQAAQLGIVEQRIAAASRQLAELDSTGDEIVGVLDFGLEGKSMSSDAAGGLVVEGYAAGFERDRQNEAFVPDASFEQSLRRYLQSNPILCYHHHYDQALGVVEDARMDSKGLFVRARLDIPEPGTELADVFRKVKSGTIKGFSIGGRFYRKQTPAGPRVYTAEIVELSVTPLPVEPGCLFTVAGKAVGTETTAQLSQLGELLDTLDRVADRL